MRDAVGFFRIADYFSFLLWLKPGFCDLMNTCFSWGVIVQLPFDLTAFAVLEVLTLKLLSSAPAFRTGVLEAEPGETSTSIILQSLFY